MLVVIPQGGAVCQIIESEAEQVSYFWLHINSKKLDRSFKLCVKKQSENLFMNVFLPEI